jgi:hypothetical protein
LRTNVVLIDFENVQVKSLARLTGEHFRVLLFVGPNQAKIPTDLAMAMQNFGARAQYVKVAKSGTNALDFHVSYYIGRLAAADPDGFYHLISKDTGFDSLIEHLNDQKILAARSESIEAMPSFRAAGGNGQEAPKPAPAEADGLGSLLKVAVEDLVKRKAAKPRKLSTLRNTVQACLGNNAGHADAVIAEMLRAGWVSAAADGVTYHLPQ